MYKINACLVTKAGYYPGNDPIPTKADYKSKKEKVTSKENIRSQTYQ